MYMTTSFLTFILSTFAVGAIPHTDQIKISITQSTYDRPSAAVEELDPPIVPLHPRARTGLFDPIYEEGLISLRKSSARDVFLTKLTYYHRSWQSLCERLL